MQADSLQVLETPEQLESSSAQAQYIDEASRYDGSRTSPQKIALIHALKREGRSVNAICQILSMSPMTVKAVLARGESLVTDARMLLKANALAFAGDAIKASMVAAEKGKIEGISAMLDRLGVTEPPKNQAQTQVGVQVVLHGGGIPEVSLAKVGSESEGPQNQAGNTIGLISPPMLTVEAEPTKGLIAQSVAQDLTPGVGGLHDGARPATNVAEVRKQA